MSIEIDSRADAMKRVVQRFLMAVNKLSIVEYAQGAATFTQTISGSTAMLGGASNSNIVVNVVAHPVLNNGDASDNEIDMQIAPTPKLVHQPEKQQPYHISIRSEEPKSILQMPAVEIKDPETRELKLALDNLTTELKVANDMTN